MSTKYTNFTLSQREQARHTDIAEFLRNYGEKTKKEGRSYTWIKDGEKISISGNVWYNQYSRDGGDAIEFARRFFNCKDYPEAVSLLLGANVGTTIQNDTVYPQTNTPFTLPSANTDMHRVYAYLIKQRCIDKDVVNAFVHKRLLFEEANYHNCVFVGIDENGITRHAHKRGTTFESSFKCNSVGSDPQYSFHWNGTSDRLYVFEAPIDMMSYISMHTENWQQHNYVALCSVAFYAAKSMLEQNSSIRNVVLCLDSDKAGTNACNRIAKELKENYPYISAYRIAPEHKDFNEDLQAIKALKMQNESEMISNCQAL